MPALNFQKQFAAKVSSGEKFTTIRQPRKVAIREGDRLHLYTGMRTRSCVKLGVAEAMAVYRIEIAVDWFEFLQGPLATTLLSSPRTLNLFAQWDGFDSWADLVNWMATAHGVPRIERGSHRPFVGDWICWCRSFQPCTDFDRFNPSAPGAFRPDRRAIRTDAEIGYVRRHYADTASSVLAARLGLTINQVYSIAARLKLKKSDRYLETPAACRLRRGDDVGKSTRFQPGHVPANKGVKGWQAGGRSAETRFKKGHRPQTWTPIGTEVVDRDGYRKRKVKDDAAPGMSRFNWVFVHVDLWEQHHGSIPAGHAVVFRNGDRSDIRIGNLELVTRRELMSRNTVHNLPKPLAEIVQLRGALQRVINRKTRSQSDEKQN